MIIDQPLSASLHQLQASRKFHISQSKQRYWLRRKRMVPEVRVFRLLFARVIVHVRESGTPGKTRLRFRLDGLAIFMAVMLTGALFTPLIPMEAGESLGYHPVVPYLLFAAYSGFAIWELRKCKAAVREILALQEGSA